MHIYINTAQKAIEEHTSFITPGALVVAVDGLRRVDTMMLLLLFFASARFRFWVIYSAATDPFFSSKITHRR
jgi:hypothetical protein